MSNKCCRQLPDGTTCNKPHNNKHPWCSPCRKLQNSHRTAFHTGGLPSKELELSIALLEKELQRLKLQVKELRAYGL